MEKQTILKFNKKIHSAIFKVTQPIISEQFNDYIIE